MLKVVNYTAKTILNRSKIRGISYTLNPYIGCQFACRYCYASYMSQLVQEKVTAWGGFVYPKINAPELLLQELPKLSARQSCPSIMLASATDAWQNIEKDLQLTRRLLQIFQQQHYPGELLCLTKSMLIARDVDLLTSLPHVHVNVTITGLNDQLSHFFEPGAPSLSQRIQLLQQLQQSGLDVGVFFCPVLPYFLSHQEELEALFQRFKELKIRSLTYQLLNFYGGVKTRMQQCLQHSPLAQQLYLDTAQRRDYQQKMHQQIRALIKKYGLPSLHEKMVTPGFTTPMVNTPRPQPSLLELLEEPQV